MQACYILQAAQMIQCEAGSRGQLGCISGNSDLNAGDQRGPGCIGVSGFRNLDLPNLGSGSVSFLKLFLTQVVCEAAKELLMDQS